MSATARTNEQTRAASREQGRVLLVADEALVRAHAAHFEAAGFHVASAEGGARALIALQRARPHVVVADAKLKGISAAEMARLLSEAQDAVPVVLVGAEAPSVERRAEAMAAGAFDYLQLPAEVSLLLARTAQLVAHKQLVDRLRAEADRDYLTNLANRRRFRAALGQELERWRRYAIPCTLLLLDVDHLKTINDTHGHPAGDRVIRSVGAALAEQSRDNDTAARLGGEEFALLLAGVDGERAYAAAERLRLSVAAQEVDGVGAVTISLGVAACPADAQSERELFAASDAALYHAKRTGRNRSETAGAARAAHESRGVVDGAACGIN